MVAFLSHTHERADDPSVRDVCRQHHEEGVPAIVPHQKPDRLDACVLIGRGIGRSSWWVGALLGALQAFFTATVLVNELLPVVHPRMATTNTSANEYALIEPPGFLMRNYGRNTFLVMLAAHIAFGTIIAALVSV